MNDKYKDYKPELVEYDEEIDGGIDEYKTRDKHLDVKANLLDKIRQKKQQQKVIKLLLDKTLEQKTLSKDMHCLQD